MKKIYAFEAAPNGLLQIIPSPSDKERWSRSVLDAMLSNSKYLGGIIAFEDYYAVQAEKGKRSNLDEDSNKRKATQYYSKDVLSGLFVCAECGAVYWRIIRPSGEIVWRCSNKGKRQLGPHLQMQWKK